MSNTTMLNPKPKILNRGILNKGLASLLIGSMAFNFSGCSTLLKNVIENTEQGKSFVNFVNKTYDSSINKETILKTPYDFYERISNNKNKEQDNQNILVRVITPGWGCPIKRYGDFSQQTSPLGKMYTGFDGLVAIADYEPKDTLEVSAKEIASQLNKLSQEVLPSKLEFELLSFSHSGNIAREIIRKNYCDNIKSVRFIASPLNGTKFLLPNDYILENYTSVLGLDKEISDPSFSQLLNGNEFYESNKIPLNKKNIDYYFIGVEHNSKVPFVQGGFFIPNKDDNVVPLSSQLFQQVAEYDGCNLKEVRIYQGQEIDHISILTNPFVLDDLINWVKNNSNENNSNTENIIVKIDVPNSNFNKKEPLLFPSLDEFDY